MKVLFQDFLSHKALFFDLLDDAAANVVEMADLLNTAVNTEAAADRELMFNRIAKLEHAGDDITHKLHLYLNKIVFPPLNRNHIHSLTSSIDDIADTIHEAAGRINLYFITEFGPAIKDIASVILKAGREIEKAVSLLRSFKNADEVMATCIQVKALEHQCDQIYYHAVAELFLNDKDPINLIKYHEILLSLETAVNKCKSTGDLLEVMMINR